MNPPAEPAGEIIPLPPGVATSVASKTPSPKAARVRVESHAAHLADATVRRELKSQVSSPPSRWSVSPEGVVQRSNDAGKTWVEVPIDSTVKFRAVASEGSEIWAGGPRGALYHSSDAGNTWVRVSVNTGTAAITDTLVRIWLTSPQHIGIRTDSGQQWTTNDGGQTWQEEP